ncbi:C1 family peptidase [Desulfonema magnum]|uniref:Peptidase C1A domain-containing protein n=1 Tax=Desulfonema magnum TaxID=45655 RepID=A0A975BIW8_9BACT|nr:C1 family peptidase [Desulfonema magnum]QTA86163.1 Peptidase C1A domain-containing protein [Desulfonema magnum]
MATPDKGEYVFDPPSRSYNNIVSDYTSQNYTGTTILTPDIDISPKSLIFSRPKSETNVQDTEGESVSSADTSASRKREVRASSQPAHYETGLIIPDEVKAHWKTHMPSRKYRSRKNLPASKDWSIYDSPVKNQKNCGSCWAFAAVALVENLGNQANLFVEQNLSEQVIVSCLYQDQSFGRGCEGGWYWDAFNYIRIEGIPPETCYPYNASDEDCEGKCSEPDFVEKITQFSPPCSLWGERHSVDDLRGALQDGPLCVSMYVPDDFFSYTSGIYDYTGGDYGFGHAVLLVGYDDEQQCFRAKNSWGEGWGERGYFRIAYNDVTDNVKFGCYAGTASGIYLEGKSEEIIIKNTGTDDLVINNISCDKTWLEISPQTLPTILPDGQETISVSVADWNDVPFPDDMATITISSNDSDEPSVFVEVKAIIPPTIARPMLMISPPFQEGISVTEDKININISGTSGNIELDVSNGNDGSMSWTATTDDPWLNIVSGNSGDDNGTITIYYESNLGDARTGTISISSPEAENGLQAVELTQAAVVGADIDDSGSIDLRDAILVLKTLAGMNEDDIYVDADVNGDRRIGIEEAVYVLQSVSELTEEDDPAM